MNMFSDVNFRNIAIKLIVMYKTSWLICGYLCPFDMVKLTEALDSSMCFF